MDNKTIFITGAGSGIGREVAKRFADKGWFVGLYDINEQSVKALAEGFGEERCCYGRMDVTKREEVERSLEAFAEVTGGRLDVLYNCAGILRIGHFERVSIQAHIAHINVNLAGLVRVTYAAFPLLAGTSGARVINMSSASADYGTPDFASYSASKFGVRGLTEALNLEWRRHGIHVCDIMPPFVRTPLLKDAPEDLTSIQRLGVRLTPQNVARTVHRAAVGRRKVHWPVGWQYIPLYYLSTVLPTWTRRLVMRWVSGY